MIKRVHPIAAVVLVPFLMGNDGGCSTTAQPPVQVVADSYCQAVKKRTWSVNDTPETIDQIVKHNSGIDRACGRPKTS